MRKETSRSLNQAAGWTGMTSSKVEKTKRKHKSVLCCGIKSSILGDQREVGCMSLTLMGVVRSELKNVSVSSL